MTDGGDGSIGLKHSKESKKKISLTQKGIPKNLSESRIEELRELMLGVNNPMKNPEVVERCSGKNHWASGLTGSGHPSFGRKDTPEMIEAKRQRMLGRKMPPCSDERREKIRKATTGVKKSTTINMRKPRGRVVCPHCGKEGGSNTMHRWHFDNCKHKENVDVSK